MEEEAVKLAVEQMKKDRQSAKTKNILIICLCVVLCVSIVCGTVLAIKTITEQQYALNMQYAGLLDLMYGAEIVETTTSEDVYVDSRDNGLAVYGNGNNFAGGDING